MRKKIAAFVLITFIAIPGLSSDASFTANSKEFLSVIKQLDMQGHADHDYSTCSIQKVYYDEVIGMLNDGMDEEEIIQSYVSEYGQAALRVPGADKSGILAWGMPFAALAAGSAIVMLWIKKGTKRGNARDVGQKHVWMSETEKEISEKIFEEERRKHF